MLRLGDVVAREGRHHRRGARGGRSKVAAASGRSPSPTKSTRSSPTVRPPCGRRPTGRGRRADRGRDRRAGQGHQRHQGSPAHLRSRAGERAHRPRAGAVCRSRRRQPRAVGGRPLRAPLRHEPAPRRRPAHRRARARPTRRAGRTAAGCAPRSRGSFDVVLERSSPAARSC